MSLTRETFDLLRAQATEGLEADVAGTLIDPKDLDGLLDLAELVLDDEDEARARLLLAVGRGWRLLRCRCCIGGMEPMRLPPEECDQCGGSGSYWRSPNGRAADYPGGPMRGMAPRIIVADLLPHDGVSPDKTKGCATCETNAENRACGHCLADRLTELGARR